MKSVKFFLIGLCSLVGFCYAPSDSSFDDGLPTNPLLVYTYDLGGAIWGQPSAGETRAKNELIDKNHELALKDQELAIKDEALALKDQGLELKDKELELKDKELTIDRELRDELLTIYSEDAKRFKQKAEVMRVIRSTASLFFKSYRKNANIHIGSSSDSDKTQGITPETSPQTSPEIMPITISCPHCCNCIFLPKSTANNGV